ncbi:MAG: dTDP-4-amino-4,6-dideoxygalactose transaminase [Bacteroidales bacterium]|nr:dTDP-4-amino-4,6-dideoxygalactose transaminase [Bacteroidales bacterium]
MKIPFNLPYVSGKENKYISDAVNHSSNPEYESYNNKCKKFIKERWNYKDLFMTSSCTAALEVCALILDIKKGDEVIIPSYTFPSTANAFIRQGAKIVFADSRSDYPGIDEKKLGSLITKRTKAIVPVHYAGIACDMNEIMKVAEKHNLYVVEDAASAIDSKYVTKQLGSIGHLGCLSFHQTKNLHCLEGGAIILNDDSFLKRIKYILEKGTNRNELVSGLVERYEWVDIGSSYMMTELHAAFLYAQLEKAEWIKKKRMSLWEEYYNSLLILQGKGILKLPNIPEYAYHNAHTFYLILNSTDSKESLRKFLSDNSIQAAVHYTSLDLSKFWKENYSKISKNPNSLRYNDCLLRLPLYNTMTKEEVSYITSSVLNYFNF